MARNNIPSKKSRREKEPQINVRLSGATFNAIKKKNKSLGITTPAQIARGYIEDGLRKEGYLK